MLDDVDLTAALAALELDVGDPADLADIALVRAIVERRRPLEEERRRGGGPDRSTGPRIERVAAQRRPRPTDRWRMP